jgi:antitoxin FitA
MNAITIRNLSDEASRALEALAQERGTSAEVEAERILQQALTTDHEPLTDDKSAKSLVAALQELGREFPELAEIDFARDQTPARGVSFE